MKNWLRTVLLKIVNDIKMRMNMNVTISNVKQEINGMNDKVKYSPYISQMLASSMRADANIN